MFHIKGKGRYLKAEKTLDRFLVKVRRRMLLFGLLRSCFWSVVANEGWKWGTIGINLLFKKELPVYFIGLYVFAVMMLRVFLSSRKYSAAREADRRMRMKDRFISYLDFHDRMDVEVVFRKAQTEETEKALLTGNLRKSFRIHPLLWGAPVLFLVMIFIGLLNPFLPEGPFYYLQKPAVHFSQGTNSDKVALNKEMPFPGGNTLSNKKDPNDQTDEPEMSTREKNGRKALKPELEEPGKNSNKGTSRDKQSSGGQPAGFHSIDNMTTRGPWEDREPVHLYSETIGKELKPVVERKTSSAGNHSKSALDSSMVIRGKVAFDLLPKVKGDLSNKDQGTDAVNAGKRRFEVVVDFDGILPLYRDYVRRYFEQLGATRDAGYAGS